MTIPVDKSAIYREEMGLIRSRRRKLNLIICVLTTSLIFIVSGFILIVSRTFLYTKSRSAALNFGVGTKAFEVFKKTPFDVYFDVYFFNWTNPQDFLDPTKKPKVQEVGPFRFLEVTEKTNITFHHNDTVSFNRTRRWFFVQEGSVEGGLETKITTINPVAVSGAYALRYQGGFKKLGFSVTLSTMVGQVHMTRTVGEMMFYGYEDPLMKIARNVPFVSKNLPPMDKFAWFYKRNGSNSFDGHFNMNTGKNNVLGQMNNWNNWNHTPYYGDTCGDVSGSAGEFFPQQLPKGPLGIFNTEMCRTIVMDYEKEANKRLINSYKYTLGDHFLDNGTKIPENRCYCTGDCVPYGMMNVSLCRYGSPGFVSLPHFYKADPYYTNLVDGLTPSDRHNFYMLLEPTTGLPLEVAARLQLNLLVKNVPGIRFFQDTKEFFFPVLWFEQVVEMPISVTMGLFILLWLKEICFLLGVAFVACGVSMIGYITYRVCTMNLFGRDTKGLVIKEMVPLNAEKIG